MSPWEGMNRRKFPRVKYPCLVTVFYEDADHHEIFLTHTENVGIGGVCVICRQRLKLFSPVSLEIDLLDMGEHLRCKGKTMWVVQRKEIDTGKPVSYDIGVEFEDIQEEDRKRLSKIVQHLGKYRENLS